MFTMKIDSSDYRELGLAFNRLPQKMQRQVLSRALGRSKDKVSREYATIAGKRMAIPISAIRKRMRTSIANDTLTINVKSNNIPLIELGRARQNRAGVFSQMRGLYRSAFLATMKSGHRGVYIRDQAGDGRSPRLGLHEVHGPSPAGEIQRNPEVYTKLLTEVADEMFLKEIRNGVIGMMKKLKAG